MASAEVVRYMSKSPNCLVSFEEIRKETKKGAIPWKMEKFKSNMLEINPAEDYGPKRGKGSGIIKRLDSHIANRANGGSEFWRMDQNAIDMMDLTEGTIIAREPVGGIKKDLDKKLEALYSKISGYDAGEHKDVVNEARNMFDLFNVMGLPKPVLEDDSMKVKGMLIMLFSTLKEREIWEALEA